MKEKNKTQLKKGLVLISQALCLFKIMRNDLREEMKAFPESSQMSDEFWNLQDELWSLEECINELQENYDVLIKKA
jgi:hypothetical protein